MQEASQDVHSNEHTAVLIVGGSLVGLSTAFFLSWLGIPSVLIEKHAAPPWRRGGGCTASNMELFRRAGIEEAIRQVEIPGRRGAGYLRAESLAGRELEWLTDVMCEEGEGSTIPCPLPVRRSDNNHEDLKPLLQTQARARGADLRFNTELVAFSRDPEGVTAMVRNRGDGGERTIRADYLIAADGSHSLSREHLGIEMLGPGIISHQLGFSFAADMQQALRGRPIFPCYVNNALVQGPIFPLGQEGLLFTVYHPEQGEREEDFCGERGIERIHAAIGLPDLPVSLLKVDSWVMKAQVAERFQQGRIFLAGDAAHLMPPCGGLGGNTGITDAYNLAWKLALVLEGKAAPALLATYDAERRAVAQATMEQNVARALKFWVDRQPAGYQPVPILNDITVSAGYRYRSAAILSSPYAFKNAPLGASPDDHERYEDPRWPTGRPGSHAAHLVLEKDNRQCSTFDLFGPRFVLLAGKEGNAWCEAARQVVASSRLALDAYCLGQKGGYQEVEGRFQDAYGVTASGAVLVRPDGFIAWRSEALATSPQHTLEQALSSLLGWTTM